MARECFAAYHSYRKAIEPLTDAERGRLFAALLEYSETGTAPDLRGSERYLYPLMKEQIDRDKKRYESRCEVNRKNGSLGGQAKSSDRCQTLPNASERYRTPPKEKAKAKDKTKTKDISPAESRKTAPLPDGLKDAVERFKEHRKQLKAPMTEYAVSLMLSKLETLTSGSEAKKIAILDQSIERGWKGVFELDKDKQSIQRSRKGGKYNYPQRNFTDEDLSHLLVDLDAPLPDELNQVETSEQVISLVEGRKID